MKTRIEQVEAGNTIGFVYGVCNKFWVKFEVGSVKDSRYNPAMVEVSGVVTSSLHGQITGQHMSIPFERGDFVEVVERAINGL